MTPPVLVNPYRYGLQTYISYVLSLGPTVFLAPMAPSGTDISGNGHNGTVTAGTPTVASPLAGDLGFTFNGTSQDVDVPNFTGVNLTTFTLMCWIRTTSATASASIWGRSGDTSQPFGMLLASGKLLGITKAPSQSTLTGTTTINTGSWVHVAFGRDAASTPTAGASRLYVGGSPDIASTVTNTPQSIAAGLSVASRGTSNFFPGDIAAPSLHSVRLTDAQIALAASLR